MKSPYDVVRDFENALCEYTGAPFAVAVNSCTMALLLACRWHFRSNGGHDVYLPRHTYIGVPMSVINAGGTPRFITKYWKGCYQLKPLPVWDSAKAFTSSMWAAFPPGSMVCLSFHASKILGDTQGGAILLSSRKAYEWLRQMRFDGRTEGVPVADDDITEIGYHCYMSPDVAARLTFKLSVLPKHNTPLPCDEYPDLTRFRCFQNERD